MGIKITLKDGKTFQAIANYEPEGIQHHLKMTKEYNNLSFREPSRNLSEYQAQTERSLNFVRDDTKRKMLKLSPKGEGF